MLCSNGFHQLYFKTQGHEQLILLKTSVQNSLSFKKGTKILVVKQAKLQLSEITAIKKEYFPMGSRDCYRPEMVPALVICRVCKSAKNNWKFHG